MKRCAWAGDDALYQNYHDIEWGQPVENDTRLFEKISLEGFQAGLSWLTILKKRAAFRAAFANFDYRIVANFTDVDVDRLLADKAIVRHRGKIESTINNAARAIEMHKEFGSLATYFWGFEPKIKDRPTDYSWEELKTIAQTDASRALSKDLKKRGWSFVGPTTAYAFMQAMGIVNDHTDDCFRRPEIEAVRESFKRPT